MLLYYREKRLLSSLHLFVCRFVSVASISLISMKAYIGDFHENLLGKSSFVKIGPKYRVVYLKTSVCFTAPSTLYRHKALPSKEVESGRYVAKEIRILRERVTMSRITYLAVLYYTDQRWNS
jgi:hypothetical protein